MVWLVYARQRRRECHATSQSMPCSSTSRRISSATATRRVRVVQLEDGLLVQVGEVGVATAEVPRERVLQRRRDEEVLLPQAKLACPAPPSRSGKARARCFSLAVFSCDGRHVIAAVEGADVELSRRLRRPEPQRVDDVVLVAGDGRVVRPCAMTTSRCRPIRSSAVALAPVPRYAAAEAHLARRSGRGILPRVAVSQPVVGLLHLSAADDFLTEDPVLVTDAVARSPGMPSVAIESRKHAARRPSPPLPSPASASSFDDREVDAEARERLARLVAGCRG